MHHKWCLSFIVAWIFSNISRCSGAVSVFGGARRDYYLDPTMYPEDLKPLPDIGIRGNIIFTVNNGTFIPPYTITFTYQADTKQTLTVPVVPTTKLRSDLDWIFVDYSNTTSQCAVTFHFNDDTVFSGMESIEVRDSKNNLMGNRKVNFQHSGVEFLRFTTMNGYTNAVMHFYNYYADAPFAIADVYLDGQQVAHNIALPALQHTPVTVKFASSRKTGHVWTVGVQLTDGLIMGWGGRIVKERFPIAGIPVNSQCPFPETNKANFATVTNLGIDSIGLTMDNTCGTNPYSILNEAAYSKKPDVMLDGMLASNGKYLDPDTFNVIDGVALQSYSPPDILSANTQTIWSDSLAKRLKYGPRLRTALTLGSSVRFGRFAGIGEISIMKYLLSGCQDVVTKNATISPRAPFQYVLNAYQNQMPNSIWAIVPAFLPRADNSSGQITPLNGGEITMMIGSALAGGAQGIVLENVDVLQQQSDASAWTAASKLLKTISILAPVIHASAPFGTPVVASPSDESIWSVLRAPSKMIVVGVNINCVGYDVSKCRSNPNSDQHWTCAKTMANVAMNLPTDFKLPKGDVSSFVERYVNGQPVKVSFTATVNAKNQLIFGGVGLSGDEASSVFVVSQKM